MPRYLLDRVEITVLTFKEGVLSAMGHDLKLRATRGWLSVEGDAVEAEVQADGLQVVCAMKDGREQPDALPGFAAPEIVKNLQKDVLETRRHPTIRFQGSATASEVRGTLTLHGAARPVTAQRRDEAGYAQAELSLDQRDFGITPFSGMLGALKVKPQVIVRVRVPLTAT